ncbi:hypothetical protein PC39_03482 [Salinisphaera sp. PC39]|uniref:hypothetical protein n=1 Tax=Salinisphaera sp. PC39 TaxID=1304156 RepID=UPI00333E64A2
MIRNTLTALLLVGFAGVVSAQGPQDVVTALNNVDGAVNNLVGNLQGTSVSLLSGDATGTANGLNDSLTGLATDLSANTPASPLGDIAVQVGDQLVAASAPLTTALDGPAGQLAALGAPLAEPAIDAIEGVEFELSLEFVAPGLPGLPGGGGGLPLPLPGLGDGGLPSLPGLDGLPALPGLDGGLPLPGLPA